MPPTPQAAKKDPELSIPVPPLGKLTYLASHQHKVLPQLTEAVKAYKNVTNMDGELREKFQAMDAFSKKIPPLSVVKDDFAKVDAAVKNEAQGLQDIELQVTVIKSLLTHISEEAKEAQKSLVITEQELKSAQDMQQAQALRAKLDVGPLFKVITKASEAVLAWGKVEEDPIGFVGKAFEAGDALMGALGLDTLNQKIHSLEEEANKLAWKSAVDKFKLAQVKLNELKTARASLGPPLKKAKDQYTSRKQNVPLDFDAYNKKGSFHFKSMTDLSDMLDKYSKLAQQAVTAAHHATENIHKMQGTLGTQWMANVNQDKDILEKMMTVTKRAMERAIHERDGAAGRIKIVKQQIDELEVLLSKTRLKPS